VPEELELAEARVHAQLEAERSEPRALGRGIVASDSDVVHRAAPIAREQASQLRRLRVVDFLQLHRHRSPLAERGAVVIHRRRPARRALIESDMLEEVERPRSVNGHPPVDRSPEIRHEEPEVVDRSR
jgi:hypothetical protein